MTLLLLIRWKLTTPQIFDQRNLSIQKATESVHGETVRIVDAQMSNMSKQMEALDDFVAKARSHNGSFHDAHLESLDAIAANVRDSRTTIHRHLDGFGEHVGQLQSDVKGHTESLEQATTPLQAEVCQPLSELRTDVEAHPLKEYVPTGITPQKRRYDYPVNLPRTEHHEGLRSRHRTSKRFTALPFNEETRPPPVPSSPVASPAKSYVYSDAAEEVGVHPPSSAAIPSNTGLREVDANVARPASFDAGDDIQLSGKLEPPTQPTTAGLDETPEKGENDLPPPKRQRSVSSNTGESKLPQKRLSKMAGVMEGRENVCPPVSAGGRFYQNRTSG